MSGERLLHITAKDFEITTFKAPGPGGQARNKTSSAVRMHHPPSGVTTQAVESRSQHENRTLAFRRMVNHPTFKRWVQRAAAEAAGRPSLEQRVADQMDPKHIITQTLDEHSRWVDTPVEMLTDEGDDE